MYCQINRADMDRLLSGRAIDLQVELPRNHSFRISVRPSALTADRGGWQLDSDPTGIWLTVPRAEIELLGQTTVVTERLMREFAVSTQKNVQVVMEVVGGEPVPSP
jgi:hypothetical protein